MMNLCCSEKEKLDLLRRLFAAATRDASEAMCRWTHCPVRLTLDEVRQLPLEDACGGLGIGDERLAMVALAVEGEIGGAMVLMFDEDNGRRLAASLLGESGQAGGGWSELEKSALTETGNILGCSYVSAIGRLIDRKLVPSIPYFICDYGASVFQQALTAQADADDSVLVCRTGFHCAGEELSWLLLFVPTVALRAATENALERLP